MKLIEDKIIETTKKKTFLEVSKIFSQQQKFVAIQKSLQTTLKSS